jgi:hypothetical protein
MLIAGPKSLSSSIQRMKAQKFQMEGTSPPKDGTDYTPHAKIRKLHKKTPRSGPPDALQSKSRKCPAFLAGWKK